MSIGNTQAYLDWSLLQDDREQDNMREAQEMMYEMTRAEREEYEGWLDRLEQGERDEQA